MVDGDRIAVLCFALKALRTMLAAGVAAAVILATVHRPETPVLAEASTEPSAPTVTAQATHDLSWYAPLWQRDLKQLPVPQKKADQSTPRNVASPPVPQLLATFVDARASYAHFKDHNGQVQLRGIDEVIDRYRVSSIEPGKVRLHDNAGDVLVEIPRSQGR